MLLTGAEDFLTRSFSNIQAVLIIHLRCLPRYNLRGREADSHLRVCRDIKRLDDKEKRPKQRCRRTRRKIIPGEGMK